MINNTSMQGVYLNVPMSDWGLLRELAHKFGWQAETREQLLNRFSNSRPAEPPLTEEELLEEVRQVRYVR